MSNYWNEREAEIERFRILKREVTDPLAASFLNGIIEELEAAICADSGDLDPTPLVAGTVEQMV
jgi:hypothetical protein